MPHLIYKYKSVHVYTHIPMRNCLDGERERGRGRDLPCLPMKGNVCLFLM